MLQLVSARAGHRSTADIIKQTKGILELPAEEYSDDATAERLEEFKTATKAYVADYRTLVSPGQKSFSETYGVITGAQLQPRASYGACWCMC